MTERRSPLYQPWGLDAIRRGDKTMTRRVCKHKNLSIHQQSGGTWAVSWCDLPGEPHTVTVEQFLARAPHGQPGDVWALCEPLHMRDGEARYPGPNGTSEPVIDRRTGVIFRWKPTWKRDTQTSMFMPQWAARDFVTLKAVRVERLQDISDEDAKAEGTESYITDWLAPVSASLVGPARTIRVSWFAELWDSINAAPKPIYRQGCAPFGKTGVKTGRFIHHYVSYPWEDFQETREYKGVPLYVVGNPLNWVYEFGEYTRDPGRTMPT